MLWTMFFLFMSKLMLIFFMCSRKSVRFTYAIKILVPVISRLSSGDDMPLMHSHAY